MVKYRIGLLFDTGETTAVHAELEHKLTRIYPAEDEDITWL